MYYSDRTAFRHIAMAENLLKGPQVALGIVPAEKVFFVGQVKFQWTGEDGI